MTAVPQVGVAVRQQDEVFGQCAAAMRVAVGSAAVVAILVAPSDDVPWVATSLAVNVVWMAVFGIVGLTGRLPSALLCGDLALTCGLCLGQGHLLPSWALSGGVSWIAGLVTVGMVVQHLGRGYRWAVPASVLLTACHVVGARWAGAPDGGAVAAGIQGLQIIALTLLARLLRSAAVLSDLVLGRLEEERTRSVELRAWHAEEQARTDGLHGTVVATLTAVATDSGHDPAEVRRQAVHALGVLAALRSSEDAEEEVVRALPVESDTFLADDLAVLVQRAAPRLHVQFTVEPPGRGPRVGATVAGAVTTAVEALLANVVRHARVDTAHVGLTHSDRGFCVTVADSGRGFDPGSVPDHRYGLRYAVSSAMRSVGGRADVDSAPGRGTRVELRWPAS